ncbi:hypothetical protein [Planktotalea sp.]|uniref:hypothetical protein n=1 Tax=Planktotalea sp. TaxID=2029877 RepID=UPI00329A73C7
MKTVALTLGLTLIATTVAAQEFHRWSGALPALVEQNLPADVPASDVLVKDGCFYYLYEGKAYKMTQSSGGAKGLPICIG